MELKRKSFDWQRRLWAIALAAVLVCIPMAGNAGASMIVGDVAIPDEAAPKPTVTIQGNVVVDKNKATGFYELALCVKTARDITDETGKLVSEEEYAKAMEEAEKAGNADAVSQKYKIKNYPFQSAAAAVHINLDALTAVTWGEGKPIYNTWMPTGSAGIAGGYEGGVEDYPRGIDLSNPDQPNIITDLSGIIKGNAVAVRLDSAGPDEITNTTALIESYDKENKTALLTLTANSTTTSNVIYNQSTPVVVVRFAYDLNRFRNTNVEADDTNFWVGLDRNDPTDNTIYNTNKAPLTYLAEGDYGVGSERYAKSDAQANESSVSQVIWYAQNMIDDNEHQQESDFYYYLGAETRDNNGAQVYQVLDGANAVPTSLTVPKTVGLTALAKKNADYPIADDPQPTGADYSFFQNLLTLKEKTLRLELVNAETYRKATGSGGTTILFYDWDDSLIGSLVVDKGDVRADVEKYIEENLVHPALRPDKVLADMGGRLPDDYDYDGSDSAQAYKELVTSLARDHTYRGKYPYTVGGDDALAVDDGEDYPLTNKLDYVFTKRVNTAAEQTVTGANGAAVTDTYVLPHKLTDKGMEDAALYPYVYGWAVVEDTTHTSSWKVMYDAKKIEDTWTTIGVGELSNVTPAYYDNGGTAVKGIPNTATATTVLTAPQFLADADERWIDASAEGQDGVEYTTKYAYSLASNGAEGYFRFMDFSNIDAELGRYQSVNGAGKDTIIVKAVYEPGNALIAGSYRIDHEPVYNKLNRFSANAGGAYSVELILERATDNLGPIQGVTRVRQPAVRQDTTIDQKWIQDNALGVDHNLSNASIATAKSLAETTYTKVDIDNGERIQFTLSLSARQNKVDYFIVEQYGYNFVSGGQRSVTNYSQVGTAVVVDNYNYFVEGDSDESDIYYDVKDYGDREGSHGFVLYGTLNSLMEYATLYNRGEITTQTKNQYLTYSNMQDANIRADKEGTLAEIPTETAIQNKLIAAAKECETAHYGEADFWNDELDCAELNYHQIQWYIIDGRLRTRTEADKELLAFCHLHEQCAALSSNKPRSWEDLVNAVTDGTPNLIDQLTLTEVETLTHLRSNTGGSQFTSVAAFKEKFVAAMNAGNKNWVDIQKHILNNEGDVDTYWWFDGSTSNPAPTSLTALGERAWYAIEAHEYPDGESRKTKAKLESARATFTANAAAAENKATTAWINMTGNLVKDHHEERDPSSEDEEYIYTYDKFSTFEEFRDAYLAVLTKANAKGYSYGTGQNAPSWEGIQHAILHPLEETYNNEPDDPTDWDFWWKDGKTPLKITSISTLLKAAQYINSGTEDEKVMGEEAMAKVTVEMLEAEPFWLRSTRDGVRWTEAPGDKITDEALQELIIAAQEAGATDWDTLQYYLVNQEIKENRADMIKETTYYWWRNGGQGTEVNFSTSNLNVIISRLQEAVLRGNVFGDPKAKQSVADKIDGGTFYKLTHLTKTDPRKQVPEVTTVADMTWWYTDVNELLDKIGAMTTFMQQQQSITDPYTLPSVLWYQAQYWILNGTYIESSSPEYAELQADDGYWWYDKEAKPEPPPPPGEDYTEAEKAADKALMADVLDQLNTGNLAKLATAKYNKLQIFDSYNQITPTAANFLKILQNLYLEPELDNYMENGKYVITWAQLEYYVETAVVNGKGKYTKAGTLVSTSDAVYGLLNEFGWQEQDFPPDAIKRTL